MSNVYLNAAWENGYAETHTQQIVLAFLAAKANELGHTKTCVAEIAACCRITEVTARNHLRGLEEAGLICGDIPQKRTRSNIHEDMELVLTDALFGH